MYSIKVTSRFKKDLKQMHKRGYNIKLLDEVINKLVKGEKLPEKNREHSLTGNWVNHRECHVTPDWILIYKVEANILVLTLTRTGSHSDLL